MGSTLGMQVRDAGSNPVLVQNFVSFLLQEFMLFAERRDQPYDIFLFPNNLLQCQISNLQVCVSNSDLYLKPFHGPLLMKDFLSEFKQSHVNYKFF